MQPGLEVTADIHERGSGVPETLANDFDVKVSFRKLAAGDYAVGSDIGFERKSTLDFCRSLTDGRLFAQISRLKGAFARCVLIIEGGGIMATTGMHPRAIKGALASIAAGWQLPYVRTRGTEETAEFIFLVLQQETQRSRGASTRHGYKPRRKRRQQLFILQGIPGIGPVRAQYLLNRFGSVSRVFTASRNELLEVSGIGLAYADRIVDLVQGE